MPICQGGVRGEQGRECRKQGRYYTSFFSLAVSLLPFMDQSIMDKELSMLIPGNRGFSKYPGGRAGLR